MRPRQPEHRGGQHFGGRGGRRGGGKEGEDEWEEEEDDEEGDEETARLAEGLELEDWMPVAQQGEVFV